jgi:hypothetical protein
MVSIFIGGFLSTQKIIQTFQAQLGQSQLLQDQGRHNDPKKRVYRILSVAGAESACTRLCPATEPAGARVALLRGPILRASAAILLLCAAQQYIGC